YPRSVGRLARPFVPAFDPDSVAFFERAQVQDQLVMRKHDALVRELKYIEAWTALIEWIGADAGMLHAEAPDTLATDGQTVRKLINRRTGQPNRTQTTVGNQWLLDMDGGPNG